MSTRRPTPPAPADEWSARPPLRPGRYWYRDAHEAARYCRVEPHLEGRLVARFLGRNWWADLLPGEWTAA